MKIAVYGSGGGDVDSLALEKAREIGRVIASRGHKLVTGGCAGIPYEAIKGAKELNGKTVGFSPGIDLKDHAERFGCPTEGFDRLVFIPSSYEHADNKLACLKYRNLSSVLYADAAVIISGRCGTLNEFTLCYDMGKIIGVLKGTGGVTGFIPGLVKAFNKPTGARIVYEEEPRRLIEKIQEMSKTG